MAEKTILPFIAPFQSVVIGTSDADGFPFSSYAPFVYHDHCYYIFISDIAVHSQNLRREERASLLFIEDEAAAANIFARKRITLQCSSAVVPRDDLTFTTVMTHFSQKFGEEMIAMLMKMQDFNLYALTALKGEATFGFGEAYRVGGDTMESLMPRHGGSGHK